MALPSYAPPEDVAVARPFWEGLARGELVLPRCSSCGAWEWYPSLSGPSCADAEYEWITLSGTGTVFSFVRVRRAFLPDGQVPYVVALIEPDGAPGVRLVANLTDESWAIGTRVHLGFEEVAGRRHPVYHRIATASEEQEEGT